MVPPGGGCPSRLVPQFSSEASHRLDFPEAGRAGLRVLVEISLATVRDPDVAAESQAAQLRLPVRFPSYRVQMQFLGNA